MFALLLTLLILVRLLLSVVVLLQAGQGGGLASLGGATTDTVLGGRQAVTILTKATWWCGGIFLALSLVLSLVPRGGGWHRAAGAAPRRQPVRAGRPTGRSPLRRHGDLPAPPGAAGPHRRLRRHEPGSAPPAPQPEAVTRAAP